MKLGHSIGLQCSAGIAECFPIGAAIPSPSQGEAILNLYCPVDVVFDYFTLFFTFSF